MVVGTRDDAERRLAGALSRHIGYTSGAYDLDRIFSTLQPFTTRTSAYRDELVAFLQEAGGKRADEGKSSDYLGEVLSFATSMGLLEAVSSRDAKLVRYAATEIGRSALGAQAVENSAFLRFFIAKIVLQADADFLLPLLLYYQEGKDGELVPYFAEFVESLRNKRLDWLNTAFPERVLFERIASQIPWLKKSKSQNRLYQVDLPTANTARHHATPRNGWIEQLGMFNREAGQLTKFGADVARALAPSGNYFWLAPASDVLAALAISTAPAGEPEDEMSFHHDAMPPSQAELDGLVEDLKEVLIQAYGAGKLIHASQASLRVGVEYVSFRCYADQRSYDWEPVTDAVFQRNKDLLQRYSAKKGKLGFYKVQRL